jgi:predicted glycoside hydrolase/deacetylase ChbG (UPF0249 family)
MYSEYLNNLIVSADDFGVSEKANARILELAKVKKLDRVAVMMGGKISAEEAKELLETGAKLDIHLHFYSKDYFEKRKGESENGAFSRFFIFLIDFTVGRYSSAKVKMIWQNQIEEFHALFGKYPDGLNSHEHTHFFPTFFRAALKLKNKFAISYLRLGRKKIPMRFIPVAFVLNTLRRFDIKKGDINTSDYLVSFDWIKDQPKFFENLPKAGQTELIFHPEREEEFQFLKENF